MHIKSTHEVAASSEATWKRLAALDRLAEWLPGVVESPADPLAVGAVRQVRLEKPAFGKEVLVERVTAVGPTRLTYDIEGGIGPLRSIVTTWAVEPSGDNSRLTVESEVRLAWWLLPLAPLVGKAWRKRLDEMAEALTRDVEGR